MTATAAPVATVCSICNRAVKCTAYDRANGICVNCRRRLDQAAPAMRLALIHVLPQLHWANEHGRACQQLIAEVRHAITDAELGAFLS